jgi:hypothetical protein
LAKERLRRSRPCACAARSVFADLERGEFFVFPGGSEIMFKYARTGYASAAGAFRARLSVPVEHIPRDHVSAEVKDAIRPRIPVSRRRS